MIDALKSMITWVAVVCLVAIVGWLLLGCGSDKPTGSQENPYVVAKRTAMVAHPGEFVCFSWHLPQSSRAVTSCVDQFGNAFPSPGAVGASAAKNYSGGCPNVQLCECNIVWGYHVDESCKPFPCLIPYVISWGDCFTLFAPYLK